LGEGELSIGAMYVSGAKGILRVKVVYTRLKKPVKSLSGECEWRLKIAYIIRTTRGSSMERIATFRTFLMEE
jgi:hypothetical protein